MAKRIGKYKVTKRESELSAVDGATISGNLDGITNLTATGTSTLTTADLGTASIGSATGLKFSSSTVTTATIAVTHSQNVDVAVTQPAGTILKDLIVWPAGNIVGGSNANADFDLSIGAASSFTDLLAATAIIDGNGLTWVANAPLYIIEDSHGHAANHFATAGIGPKGGPATSEAIVVAGALYSAADRTINCRWKLLTIDAATAATTLKHVFVWQYV